MAAKRRAASGTPAPSWMKGRGNDRKRAIKIVAGYQSGQQRHRGREIQTRGRRRRRSWTAVARASAGGSRVGGDGGAVADGGSGNVEGEDDGLS